MNGKPEAKRSALELQQDAAISPHGGRFDLAEFQQRKITTRVEKIDRGTDMSVEVPVQT